MNNIDWWSLNLWSHLVYWNKAASAGPTGHRVQTGITQPPKDTLMQDRWTQTNNWAFKTCDFLLFINIFMCIKSQCYISGAHIMLFHSTLVILPQERLGWMNPVMCCIQMWPCMFFFVSMCLLFHESTWALKLPTAPPSCASLCVHMRVRGGTTACKHMRQRWLWSHWSVTNVVLLSVSCITGVDQSERLVAEQRLQYKSFRKIQPYFAAPNFYFSKYR